MEDKSVKNFDRHIEQMMNEHSVDPPFGAWNRIAAELESVPSSAVTTTTVSSQPWLNTGTILGFISGALMIGTLVTGWFAYSTYKNYNTESGKPTSNNDVKVNEQSFSQTFAPSAIVTTEAQQTSNHITKHRTSTHVAVTSKEEVLESSTVKISKNEEVAAPTVKLPVDKQKNASEPYYFPPVDINVPENKVADNSPVANNEILSHEEEPAKVTEVKKVTPSTASFEKVKFKRKKKTGWTYGKINRTKSKSKF